MRILTLVIAALVTTPAMGQSAVDGDTLKHSGVIWRLWGIDAAEKSQWCGDYPAGVRAWQTLDALMAGKRIRCETKATDRYGRSVGLCRADGVDLSAQMVRLGQAWAFVRYSRDYADLEEGARRAGLGVWAHECQAPWDWRVARR